MNYALLRSLWWKELRLNFVVWLAMPLFWLLDNLHEYVVIEVKGGGSDGNVSTFPMPPLQPKS